MSIAVETANAQPDTGEIANLFSPPSGLMVVLKVFLKSRLFLPSQGWINERALEIGHGNVSVSFETADAITSMREHSASVVYVPPGEDTRDRSKQTLHEKKRGL